MTDVGSERLRAKLAEEQKLVEKAVQQWKEWWTEMKQMGYPHFGELGLHLSRIYQGLKNHFEHEEKSGHLEHLANAASADPNTYIRLVEEHSEILARLKGLTDRLQIYTSSEFSWVNACQEFDSILDSLRCHEQKEMELAKVVHLGSGIKIPGQPVINPDPGSSSTPTG